MSDLHDAMDAEAKSQYAALMQLWSEAIHAYNTKDTTAENDRHPETFQDANKQGTATYVAELTSIVDQSKRFEKTLKDGSKKNVDLISSDAAASTSNVGASVGAYKLPEDTDGIYEIRSIPYTDIKDTEKVKTLYNEIITAYGVMTE